ncbi:MAG: AroM family protein [Candidatus Bathyarchaeales archaeon]
MEKIGAVTIGQSPRLDITSDLRQHLPTKIALIEAGVLDGLSREYVEEKMCPSEGDITYVSKMADGSQVKLAKSKIIPIMQKRITQLEEKEANLIMILCTGEFPNFKAKVPIIYAGEVLKGLFSGFKYEGKVGILVPLAEQIKYTQEKWKGYFENLAIFHASPYTSTKNDFCAVAKKFKESEARLIIMDCMGYTSEQKSILKEYADLPVVSSRSALIRFLNELLE